MQPAATIPDTGQPPGNDELLDAFLERVRNRGLSLYPSQEEAILDLFAENNVILNTPTGSGKSLVATALHFKALKQGRRSVYTCPIKALVNEKWLALCREFGPENVGLSTGDATLNKDAPILCCTAEILSNIALREGPAANVADVIMDEFHYYSDRSRGVAWQVPLLTLPQSRFLLMSATLGDTGFFEEELTSLNGRPTSVVRSVERPVPLEFSYSEMPLSETVESLVRSGRNPVYVVHFTQAEAAKNAQNFTSLPLCSREQKAAIAKVLESARFNSPYGPEIKRWLRSGIGIHHAGLLPKYRLLVEELAQKGLLPVICGTDTLGVGINVPIRTVLFTQLYKYGGEKTGLLSARDFHQISGRAGRKGFDSCGWVVAQAPEHSIENLQLEKKQAETGKKFVKRKPPEKNYTHWERGTFEKLIASTPERLTSSFQISHGMLLNVLSRRNNGARAMREIITRCHEGPKAKKALFKRGWQLFRSMLEQKVVEILPRQEDGTRIRVNIALQDDFSLNHALSLYLLDTLPLLDTNSPEYPFFVLTLVESILEDPDAILRKQLDRVKGDAIAEMKAQGMEFDQRMEALEKLEYPKPNRDFIYSTFNAFAAAHPWVGRENIRPKSIAREMFEEYRSFADYIKFYDLQRSEGLLLRHLSSVHKVLSQTVPDSAKNEVLVEMEQYLGALIKQVDSSLLEQWEKMRNPEYTVTSNEELKPPGANGAAADITRDTRVFRATVRTCVLQFLRALANGDYAGANETLEPHSNPGETCAPWSESRLEAVMNEYYQDHERLRLDPEARNTKHSYFETTGPGLWRLQQTLVDPAESNDWFAEFDIDLAESKARGSAVLRLTRIGGIA